MKQKVYDFLGLTLACIPLGLLVVCSVLLFFAVTFDGDAHGH